MIRAESATSGNLSEPFALPPLKGRSESLYGDFCETGEIACFGRSLKRLRYFRLCRRSSTGRVYICTRDVAWAKPQSATDPPSLLSSARAFAFSRGVRTCFTSFKCFIMDF